MNTISTLCKGVWSLFLRNVRFFSVAPQWSSRPSEQSITGLARAALAYGISSILATAIEYRWLCSVAASRRKKCRVILLWQSRSRALLRRSKRRPSEGR